VSPRWRNQLETEYAQFVDIIREWQQLQIERVQSGKQRLAERIEAETASFTTRYRELELSLKMQHKRLALLTAQVM
jgi:stearoyl-CoA desaturase (delta-9 desaturase)